MKNYTLHWQKTSFKDVSLSTAPNSATAQFVRSVSFVCIFLGNGSGSIQVMAGWQWLKCTFEHVISSVTELSAQESSASADTHTHTHTHTHRVQSVASHEVCAAHTMSNHWKITLQPVMRQTTDAASFTYMLFDSLIKPALCNCH